MEAEKNILSALRDGSPKAFEQLFHAYGGKLYNFIFKLSSGNAYLAEEIVQSVFVRVWETHASLDPDRSFLSYLFTIARNTLINAYEHQTVEYIYREYMLKTHPYTENTTEKETDRNLLEELIDHLIEKLPPARKQVFILSRKKMLSNEEIARQLRLSENTVRNQLAKAVAFMREQLAKHYDYIIYLLFFVN